MTHPRNLCATVTANGRKYETARCTVGHSIDPCQNGGRRWTMDHQWTDHKGGLAGGTCIHCNKKLNQVRTLVRVEPRVSNLARDIARTPCDVPPVIFRHPT